MEMSPLRLFFAEGGESAMGIFRYEGDSLWYAASLLDLQSPRHKRDRVDHPTQFCAQPSLLISGVTADH